MQIFSRYVLILISFLFLNTFIYSLGISHSFSYGSAFSNLSSPDYRVGDINPAGFVFVQKPTLGVYNILQNNETLFLLESEIFPSQSSIYLAIPYQKFGFYLELLSTSPYFTFESSSIIFNGFSFGTAWLWNKQLSLGFYTEILSFQENFYLSFSLGTLYLIPISYSFFSFVGLYDVTFGFSWKVLRFSIENPVYNAVYSASFQLKFFNWNFFSGSLSSSFFLGSNLSEVAFSTGLSFSFFTYFFITLGISGKDYIDIENFFWSLSLNLPLYYVNLNILVSQGILDINNYANFEVEDLSFQLSLEYLSTFERGTNLDSNNLFSYKINPEKFFTPNGDGKGDRLEVKLFHKKIKKVRLWTLIILDEKKKVMVNIKPNLLNEDENQLYSFPQKIYWYGFDHKNEALKSKSYFLKFSIIDTNGKRYLWDLGSTFLDNTNPDFTIFSPQKKHFLFSTEKLTIFLKDNLGDINRYSILLKNIQGKTVYSEIINPHSKEYTFSLNNNYLSSLNLEKGEYYFEVEALDFALNKTKTTSEIIYLYSSKDDIGLEFSSKYFSPNQDGRKDFLEIFFNVPFNELLKSWKVSIVSFQNKREVYQFKGNNTLPERILWKGESFNSGILKSGLYFFILSVILDTGIEYESISYEIYLDNVPPKVTLSSSITIFSPDGDGTDDIFPVYIDVQDSSGVLAYKLNIYNHQDTIVKTFQGVKAVPNVIQWTGVLETGLFANSFDSYYAELFVLDYAGNTTKSSKLEVSIDAILNSTTQKYDLTRPQLTLQLPNIYFLIGQSKPVFSSYAVLVKLLLLVKKYFLDYDINISGHSDYRGSQQINNKISQERADFIKRHLVNEGISFERIKSIGLGYSKPLFTNKKEVYQARNRRIEITFKKRSN